MNFRWPFRRKMSRAARARSARPPKSFRPLVEILEDRCAPAVITEFGGLTAGSQPRYITPGPDGNLWFTELNGNKIGRITPAGNVSEFTVPTASGDPLGITAGPDGNLWFTEVNGNKIGRITPAGTFTEFSVPTAGSESFGITAGPDGNLWFTEEFGNKIGRITPAGTVSEFTVPTASSDPLGITAGPDGNLWFTELNGNQIGRITPAGTVTEFAVLTAGSGPAGITAGPDGNLWFTELNGNKIGRITPAGTVTEFTVPTAGSEPFAITAGPDGNLWFAEFTGNQIGRITPAGTVTEFTVPTAASGPVGITAGPDGNLWFTELNGNQIGRLTVQPPVVEFGVPTAGSDPDGITVGPDGNLWFTEDNGNKIGRITPAGTVTEFTVPTAGSLPAGITAGPDGNLWFTEAIGKKIGRITPAGTFTEFGNSLTEPVGITAGPDGNLWFADEGDKIGRITPAGTITEFTVPTAGSLPFGITAGPDGNLWFTESIGNKIGRITPAGTVSEFTVPTTSSDPFGITAGPDGNLWFTEESGNKIGRITPAGTITEFAVPTANSDPQGITAGPDGNLWFAETNGNQIGRITPAGTVTEFAIPTANSFPHGITAGPDGNLWFTEGGSNQIGRLSLVTVAPTLMPAATTYNSYNQNFTAEGGTNVGYKYSAVGPIPFGMHFNSTGLLSGTPTVSGTFELLVTAKDSFGDGGSQLYFFTANPPITLSPATLPVAALNVSYSQLLSASGGSGGYTFSEAGTLPPGLSLTIGGVLSGTVTASTALGTYNITIVATDSNGGNGAQAYLLTVDPASTTTVTPPVSPVAGFPATFLITVSSTSGTPTGTVQLFDNGTSLGGAVLNAAGQATIVTSSLIAGTHSPITATYSGDAVYALSTSAPLSLTVLGLRFSDNFNRTGPDLGANWEIPPLPPALRFTHRREPGFDGFQIQGYPPNGMAVSVGPSFDAEQVATVPPLTNPSVQADVNAADSSTLAVGVMARLQSTGDAYIAALNSSGVAEILLFHGANRTVTVLAAAPTPGNITAGTIQFVVNGSSLALYLNGTSTPLVSVTDKTLTAPGGVGIFTWGPDGTVDNFLVGGS